MTFDQPAGQNLIDQLKVVGKPADRIDGEYKTTGTAPYGNDRQEPEASLARGYVVGAGIAKGRIVSIDTSRAETAAGGLAVVAAANAGTLDKGEFYVAKALAGPEIDHYHQVVAVVIAEPFDQARAVAALISLDVAATHGAFDLSAAKDTAPVPKPGQFSGPTDTQAGDFEGAFTSARRPSGSMGPTAPPTSPTR